MTEHLPEPATAVHSEIAAWAASRFDTEPIAHLEPAEWGFAKPSAIAILDTGDLRVIQLFDGPGEATRSAAGAAVLAREGIRTPCVIESTAWRSFMVVVSEYVPGAIAATTISTPKGIAMAKSMGTLYGSIRAISEATRDAGPWTGPAQLRRAAEGWSQSVPARISALVRDAASAVAAEDWVPALSHGDYVPANALLDDDGYVSAVLDTADVGWRHPLVDAAWWSLIVRHHHAAQAPALEAAFLTGSALSVSPSEGVMSNVALLRCAELCASHSPPGNIVDLTESAAKWCRHGHAVRARWITGR